MVFHPLHSETEHSHQIQLIPQGNKSVFDIQAQAPRNSHSLSRALLPCKGRTPQRAKGTPSKGHNYLKPFIKYPVEVQTEGNSVFPGCATEARSRLWWASQNRNLPRLSSVYSCCFKRVHVFCRVLTCQLQKLLFLPSQSKQLQTWSLRGLPHPISSCAAQGCGDNTAGSRHCWSCSMGITALTLGR